VPNEFAEYDDEPQTQSSSRRSGGPPRKHTGVGVLDPDDDISAPPQPTRLGFTAFLIIAVLATMILILFFLTR
jgi:hypothetical protein